MEQMIVFVYDTNYCQTEEDDPQKAVLFFHPKWVSDQQRLALCGQLMGAAHFCSSVFSTPQVLSLQSGKFILKKFDQFILSVGSDQTLPDWILNERFYMLQNFLEFYHKSFHTILVSVNSEYELFTKKLYEIFEIYSPLIEYVVSMFGNIPNIKFPKKSTLFLEAFQLLESCCNYEGVLGGTILHNNRVIATLLDTDVTKILALTDPHRVRCSGEQIKTPFHLPIGVQLIKVYVNHSAWYSEKKFGNGKPPFVEKSGTEENVSQGLESKQEYTKIFTVPEEDDGSTNYTCRKDSANTWSKEVSKKRSKSKLKGGSNLRGRSKNFTMNHNMKICSTPTIEKKFVHEDLVSICSNTKVDSKPATKSVKFIPDLNNDSVREKESNKFLQSRYSYNCLYRISMDDLMIDFSHRSYPVPLRYYCFGLPKICREEEQSVKTQSKKKLYRTRFYKTIADPLNPLFRNDGFPVSKSFYNHCLDEHYKDFITANITIDSREEFIKKKNLENELFKLKNEKKCENRNDSEVVMRLPNDKYPTVEKDENTESIKPRDKGLSSANQKIFRMSLTLPLKPMSFIGSESNIPLSVVKNKVLHARTPTTPLMTKLSLLVLEEQNENKSTANVPPSQSTNKAAKEIKKQINIIDSKNSKVINCALFVCGQRNLTMLLLLEEKVEQNPDLILSLWELCNSNLEKIEMLRNLSVDHVSGNGIHNYNFLSFDPQWGTMQKSGAWGNDEMKVVGSLHQDLIQTPNITEIIVRNEDAVIYGYRCGSTETFYHQGGSTAVGLPTPADLMGVIPLKARRRLERDHKVILL